MPTQRDLRDALNRREALAAAGSVGLGAALFAFLRGRPGDAFGATADASATCVLTPEQTEGPYYIDNHLIRRNITEGEKGVPLELRLTLEDSSCKPIHGATVEVWHADALGHYSGFDGTSRKSYLRGGRKTSVHGRAIFDTIYPGWYQGRTTHIHVKVHVGGNEVHTGQLYFRDSSTDSIYRRSPYSSRGTRSTRNSSDNIYAAGGRRSLVALKRDGSGYIGRATLVVKR
jgi:protocatechuate 3,4-dioxygenase beta subunit